LISRGFQKAARLGGFLFLGAVAMVCLALNLLLQPLTYATSALRGVKFPRGDDA
jgi:hypothetical protein